MLCKQAIRKNMRLKRKQMNLEQKKRLDAMVTTNFAANISLENIPKIASYIPMDGEVNTNGLRSLISVKNAIFYPVIISEQNHLSFRSACGESCISIPDLVIVPLVAFDKKGYRIGFGKGWYDKTISYIRALRKNVKFVGLAYQMQCMEDVMHNNWDEKLNVVITEKKAFYF